MGLARQLQQIANFHNTIGTWYMYLEHTLRGSQTLRDRNLFQLHSWYEYLLYNVKVLAVTQVFWGLMYNRDWDSNSKASTSSSTFCASERDDSDRHLYEREIYLDKYVSGDRMIASQRPMMLESAISLAQLVKEQTDMTWSDTEVANSVLWQYDQYQTCCRTLDLIFNIELVAPLVTQTKVEFPAWI